MICKGCGEDFQQNGRAIYCSKSCRSEHYKTLRRGCSKEAGYRKKRSSKIREILAEIKIKKGCELCGYNKFAGALHFNHKNPEEKSFDISSNPRRKLSDTMAEIEKCNVLCANCHAEHTFKNNHHMKA